MATGYKVNGDDIDMLAAVRTVANKYVGSDYRFQLPSYGYTGTSSPYFNKAGINAVWGKPFPSGHGIKAYKSGGSPIPFAMAGSCPVITRIDDMVPATWGDLRASSGSLYLKYDKGQLKSSSDGESWTNRKQGQYVIGVDICGGGGGGAGSIAGSSNGGAGGGGGAFASFIIDLSIIPLITITIGLGGAGGAKKTHGSAGGATSLWLRNISPEITYVCGGGGRGLSGDFAFGGEGGKISDNILNFQAKEGVVKTAGYHGKSGGTRNYGGGGFISSDKINSGTGYSISVCGTDFYGTTQLRGYGGPINDTYTFSKGGGGGASAIGTPTKSGGHGYGYGGAGAAAQMLEAYSGVNGGSGCAIIYW